MGIGARSAPNWPGRKKDKEKAAWKKRWPSRPHEHGGRREERDKPAPLSARAAAENRRRASVERFETVNATVCAINEWTPPRRRIAASGRPAQHDAPYENLSDVEQHRARAHAQAATTTVAGGGSDGDCVQSPPAGGGAVARKRGTYEELGASRPTPVALRLRQPGPRRAASPTAFGQQRARHREQVLLRHRQQHVQQHTQLMPDDAVRAPIRAMPYSPPAKGRAGSARRRKHH